MQADEIRFLLPDVFRRSLAPGSPLAALLHVMDSLHAPVEDAIAQFPDYLDPMRTPELYLPMLARWLDLDRLFDHRMIGRKVPPGRLLPTGIGPLRELIARAAELSRWRGTARGLQSFLETATGRTGFQILESPPGPDGHPQPFHIRIICPAAAHRDRQLIMQIVQSEKPAYVTVDELQFEPPATEGTRD